MTLDIKHATLTSIPDDPAYDVGSDEWNAAHAITMATARMLGRTSSGAGAVEELTSTAVASFLSAQTYVASIAALKALDTTSITSAYLTEYGREGAWVWKTGNYAARVSADTLSGLYAKADAIATTVGAWVRAYDGQATVKWWGAVGDGVTDDTAALQAALDSNMICLVPPGRYRTTANLVVDPIRNRACGFVGTVAPSIYPDTSQAGGPDWSSGAKECVIWYDGSTGATTSVIVAASDAVGTEPASSFTTIVLGLVLRNIVIDGNDKANHGFYAVRLAEADIHHCIVRKTAGDGWYLNGIYSGLFSSISANQCDGRGISIGAARIDHSWSAMYTCNGVTFVDLWASSCGIAGTFNEATSDTTRAAGCGIYFGPHRSCHIYRATAELCDGYGFVFSPTGGGNTLQGIYTELCSNTLVTDAGTTAIASGRASRNNGICFIGASGGVSYHNRIVDGWFGSGAIYVGGTAPATTRNEGAIELYNCAGGSAVEATHAMYRLVNCAEEFMAAITGTASTGASVMPSGVQFDKDGDTLKYYDEGSWTPVIQGSGTAGTMTYSVNNGYYTRIGNRVFYELNVVVSGITVTPVGQVRITLPLTSVTSGNYSAAAVCSYWLGLTSEVSGGTIGSNVAYMEMWGVGSGTVALLNANEITSSTRFRVAGSYRVA